MVNHPKLDSYWSIPEAQLFEALVSSRNGLTSAEAETRLTTYGANLLMDAVR